MSNCKIILVKANWCGHCHHFFPIFKKANKLNSNKDIKYLSYDTATKEYIEHDKSDDDENQDESKNKYKNKSSREFKNDYPKLENSISGFPSVVIILKDKDGKEIDNMLIEHVIIDDKEGKTLNEKYKKAAERFNKNVLNGMNTLKSGKKTLYVEANDNKLGERIMEQRGGKKCGEFCSLNKDKNEEEDNDDDLEYKNKYYKYKSKYLELKKKFNK